MAKVKTTIKAFLDFDALKAEKTFEMQGGKKYYPIEIVIFDEPNKWGKDVAINDVRTKEERQAKAKYVKIGSGKVLDYSKPNPKTEVKQDDASENLPF